MFTFKMIPTATHEQLLSVTVEFNMHAIHIFLI